jgi:hypothetical protein
MPIHHHYLQCSAQVGEGCHCLVRCLRERGSGGGSGHAADPLNLIAFDPREVSLVGEFYAATMESQMPDSWVVAGMLGSRVVAGVLGACKNVWWSPKTRKSLVVAEIPIGCICFGGRKNVLVVARTPIG